MKPRPSNLSLLCALVLMVGSAHVQAQTAHLTLQSQPGDYIGQGQTVDLFYTPMNSTFFSAQVRRTINGAPAEINFSVGSPFTPNTFSSLFFGTDQLGIPMQPGVYQNAQRADFATAGHPGLDVSFQNRGSNTLTGSFTVTNFVYSSTLGIQSFAVSFEQHSEGATPALFGTFTYSAVPEPGTVALLSLGAVGGAGAWLRRQRKRTAQQS